MKVPLSLLLLVLSAPAFAGKCSNWYDYLFGNQYETIKENLNTSLKALPDSPLYFSKNTELRLKNFTPKQMLSSESGREPLKLIWTDATSDWGTQLIDDYAKVMNQIPDLELMVTSDFTNYTKHNRHINQLPAPIKDRIHLVKINEVKGLTKWTQDYSKPIIGEELHVVRNHDHLNAAIEQTQKSGLKDLMSNVKKDRKFKEWIEGAVHQRRVMVDGLNQKKLIKLNEITTPFEGGNIIVGEKHIFVGSDHIEYLVRTHNLSREQALLHYQKEMGKPIFEIGKVVDRTLPIYQEIDFHLDVFMSVVFDHKKQKEVILLGSTDLFLEHMKKLKKNPIKSDHELNFLAKSKPKHFNHNYLLEREHSLLVIKKELQSAGYEVIPVPSYYHEDLPLMTVTNNIYSGRNAILSETGIRSIDDFQIKLMKQLGYSPTLMQSAKKSAEYLGGIRCLSQTFRKPYSKIQP